MQFEYVLQYRDAAEALAYRFPGDPAPRPAARTPAKVHLLGWIVFFIAAIILFLLLSRQGAFRRPGSIDVALSEPDHLDHPVFVIGIVLAAIGAAMMIVPSVYVLARRRSSRPIFDVPATFEIGEAGITLRTAARELLVRWDGIVAVGQTRRLLVLKTTGDLRLILPLRSIPSPQALQATVAELHRRVPPLAGVVHAPGVAA